MFGGPVATRVTPLLDRVMKQLSTEALTALQELALAPVALAAPALKVLYHDPAPLQELRDASLLAAYGKCVQLLPMVAALIRTRLSAQGIEFLSVHAIFTVSLRLSLKSTNLEREVKGLRLLIKPDRTEHAFRFADVAQLLRDPMGVDLKGSSITLKWLTVNHCDLNPPGIALVLDMNVLFSMSERQDLRNLSGLLLKNLKRGLGWKRCSAAVPGLDERCRRLRRAESCLQCQSQCVAMQDLHMMLIPGNRLFIGQRDERTLLSHDGNSFLSGDAETKQAASGGDLFLYGGAIISHRISLSRVVMMC
ncbi:MAG TPA: hypothetical protein VEL69_05030 [Ktedonobacteraceae bacterium]|nr:hypothetical protein [Ktedonobacteraceae bacterium]